MKEIVIFPIRRSRRPEALPQGVSSLDLPDGRKVIGLLSQTHPTEPAVAREAVRLGARAASFAVGGISPNCGDAYARSEPANSNLANSDCDLAADRDPTIFVEVYTNAASKSRPLMAARDTVRKRSIDRSSGNAIMHAVGRGEFAEQTPDHGSTPDENEQLMKAVRFIAGLKQTPQSDLSRSNVRLEGGNNMQGLAQFGAVVPDVGHRTQQ